MAPIMRPTLLLQLLGVATAWHVSAGVGARALGSTGIKLGCGRTRTPTQLLIEPAPAIADMALAAATSELLADGSGALGAVGNVLGVAVFIALVAIPLYFIYGVFIMTPEEREAAGNRDFLEQLVYAYTPSPWRKSYLAGQDDEDAPREPLDLPSWQPELARTVAEPEAISCLKQLETMKLSLPSLDAPLDVCYWTLRPPAGAPKLDAPPILCIHGFDSSVLEFRFVAPKLAEAGHTVHMIDWSACAPPISHRHLYRHPYASPETQLEPQPHTSPTLALARTLAKVDGRLHGPPADPAEAPRRPERDAMAARKRAAQPGPTLDPDYDLDPHHSPESTSHLGSSCTGRTPQPPPPPPPPRSPQLTKALPNMYLCEHSHVHATTLHPRSQVREQQYAFWKAVCPDGEPVVVVGASLGMPSASALSSASPTVAHAHALVFGLSLGLTVASPRRRARDGSDCRAPRGGRRFGAHG